MQDEFLDYLMATAKLLGVDDDVTSTRNPKLALAARIALAIGDLQKTAAGELAGKLMVDVKKCQRCGSDHHGMIFERLSNPVDEFTFYGFCPTNGQPVLMQIREAVTPPRPPEGSDIGTAWYG